VPTCHTHVLHDGPLVAVRDAVCCEPRSGPRVEEYARGNTLHFTRAGVYVTHQGAGARRTVVADPAHVLLFNEHAPFRVSHPADGGDASTVLDFAAVVGRAAVARHDRAAWRDDAAPFRTTHVLATPALLLQLHALRRGLADRTVGRIEAEETALAILDAVARDAARLTDARPVAQRADTRRARRELAEAVKARLAADPAADVTLPALAREVAASPFHLARTFRAEAGVPVHQYLLRLRLNLALDRLADEPSTPLSTLALDLGFASHAHLTVTFRRVFGLAPSEARSRLRRGRRGAIDAA
jgi:AraC-like DNA-binding protein